jgi:hypothetical protein
MKAGRFGAVLLDFAYQINICCRIVFLRAGGCIRWNIVMTPASTEVPAWMPMNLPTVGRATEVRRRRPIVTCDPRTETTRPSGGVEDRSGISFGVSRRNVSLPAEMTGERLGPQRGPFASLSYKLNTNIP